MYKNTYQEIAVQTASPTKVVVMLYEAGIRFLRQSVTAIESKDLNRKRQSIDRAIAIIDHLHSSLDTRGGEIATDLDKLYTYISSRILEGSGQLKAAPLEEAIKLLTVLLSGWEQLAQKEQEKTVHPALLAQPPADGRFELHA